MADIDAAVVELPGGRIRGFFTRKGRIFRARGVKYAKAARLRKPELIERWDDTWDCTKPAAISPQLPSRLAAVMGPIGVNWPQSEDCLHVSIAVPSEAVRSMQSGQGSRVPVMVFFHGGAYITGGGDLDCYDPSPLAAHGVAVVNVTYRLGIFGYPKSDSIATPNLGLLDQIASLKWVQRNIAHLGGDPGNVTIFGQSAGADSVFTMLYIDETQDLFHRAILQSAPFGPRGAPFEERERMEKHMDKVTLESLGDRDVASLTTEEILQTIHVKVLVAATEYSTGILPYGPSFSRQPLSNISQAVASLSDIGHCRKPLLISYTRDDGSVFASMDKWMRPFVDAPVIGTVLLSLKQWFYSRQMFAWGSRKLFRKVNESGGQAALVYFSHRFQQTLGASHCIELPYLMGSWSAWEKAPMLGGPGSEHVIERVGLEVRKLWVAFASGSNLGGQYFEVNDSFHFRA